MKNKIKNIAILLLFPLISFGQSYTEVYTRTDTILVKVEYTNTNKWVCGHYEYDSMYVIQKLFTDPFCKRFDGKEWCLCKRIEYDGYLGLDKKYKFGRIVNKVVAIIKTPKE